MRAVRPSRPGQNRVQRTLTLSVVEGVLYAAMVGLGEIWFVADVVRLGGQALTVILVATLPLAIGSLGAVGALRLLGPSRPRRPLVVGAVAGQALVLAVLAGLTALGAVTAWGVVGLACAYHACGQAAATGWSSWFGDLVPAQIRGRYFGRRNAWVHGATFVGLLIGGTALHFMEPLAAQAHGAGGSGYAILFGAAAAFRLVSAVLLGRSWEPRRAPSTAASPSWEWLRSDAARPVRRLLPTAAGFLAAVCVASPLFAPFQLQVLHFSYPVYMAAQGVVVIVKLVALQGWGRAVDAVGARRTWPLAAVLIGLIPLPWIWAEGAGIVLCAQGLSGLAWGGYEVSLFALLLSSADPAQRPRLFALHSVLTGMAQLVGGLIGAALFAAFAGDYRAMFGLTAALRLAMVPMVVLAVRAFAADGRPALRDLALRVVAFRPHGGLALRPIDRPSNEASGVGDRAQPASRSGK